MRVYSHLLRRGYEKARPFFSRSNTEVAWGETVWLFSICALKITFCGMEDGVTDMGSSRLGINVS